MLKHAQNGLKHAKTEDIDLPPGLILGVEGHSTSSSNSSVRWRARRAAAQAGLEGRGGRGRSGARGRPRHLTYKSRGFIGPIGLDLYGFIGFMYRFSTNL